MNLKHTLCIGLVALWMSMATQVQAVTLLINQVSPYLGYGYGLSSWNNMTADLNAAFGAGNITVDSSPLTNLAALLTYDRLWITPRQPGDPGLSATEQSNLSAYIAAGHRVALIGENSSWSDWDNSILAPVGGSYSGADTSDTLTPAIVHPLTAGVSSLNTIVDGIAGTAVGGTPVFNENVITLWGLTQSVVSILSVNLQDDTYGASFDNPIFMANLANWLAAPEPGSATLLLVGAGCALVHLRRRRRHRSSLG